MDSTQKIQHLSTSAKQLFVLEEQKTYKFNSSFYKVHGFSPIFNDTSFVLASKGPRKFCALHINDEGNIIKSIQIENSDLIPFALLSDRIVVWIHNQNNLILQWNIQTDELLEFPYFIGSQAQSQDIIIFPQTRLLCVIQKGNCCSNYMKIVYFEYPMSMQSEPIYQFESNDSVIWTYEQQIRRANTYSMLLWFKSSQRQQINFKTLELSLNQYKKYQHKFKQYRIPNIFKTTTVKTEFFIAAIWQCTSQKFMMGALCDKNITTNNYPNCIYILGEEDDDDDIFREAKFSFDGKFKFQVLDFITLGNTTMVRTFLFDEKQAMESPIYFIDSKSQCIVARSSWKCSYKSKYFLTGSDMNMIFDARFENGDVSEIDFHSMKAVNPQELIIFLMETLVQQIDFDLVAQTLNVIQLSSNL